MAEDGSSLEWLIDSSLKPRRLWLRLPLIKAELKNVASKISVTKNGLGWMKLKYLGLFGGL